MDSTTDFDRECLHNAFNRPRTPDYRSIFQQDLSRIRLHGRLPPVAGPRRRSSRRVSYDFYRTRLTHSLDVRGVAESICAWLATRYTEMQIDRHLLEAVCLAHDIGHPPFGHAGERVLNKVMEKYGGFEGQRADPAHPHPGPFTAAKADAPG